MRMLQALLVLVPLLPLATAAAQSATRRLYVVPGVHYGSLAGTTVALTAFVDGRRGTVGKGYITTLAGGRDAVRASAGIADVSATLGYSVQLGAMQMRSRLLDAVPNSYYAGPEFHVYISVVNLGAGFYAPIGAVNGRKGQLALRAGLGF